MSSKIINTTNWYTTQVHSTTKVIPTLSEYENKFEFDLSPRLGHSISTYSTLNSALLILFMK